MKRSHISDNGVKREGLCSRRDMVMNLSDDASRGVLGTVKDTSVVDWGGRQCGGGGGGG